MTVRHAYYRQIACNKISWNKTSASVAVNRPYTCDENQARDSMDSIFIQLETALKLTFYPGRSHRAFPSNIVYTKNSLFSPESSHRYKLPLNKLRY